MRCAVRVPMHGVMSVLASYSISIDVLHRRPAARVVLKPQGYAPFRGDVHEVKMRASGRLDEAPAEWRTQRVDIIYHTVGRLVVGTIGPLCGVGGVEAQRRTPGAGVFLKLVVVVLDADGV